jgi:hypothetical protein
MPLFHKRLCRVFPERWLKWSCFHTATRLFMPQTLAGKRPYCPLNCQLFQKIKEVFPGTKVIERCTENSKVPIGKHVTEQEFLKSALSWVHRIQISNEGEYIWMLNKVWVSFIQEYIYKVKWNLFLYCTLYTKFELCSFLELKQTTTHHIHCLWIVNAVIFWWLNKMFM